MGRSLLDRAAGFLLAQRRRKRWQKAVSAMAAVVVFCTTYALILPAITLSNDPICGLEEHTHTEECYAAELRYPQSSMDCTLVSGGAPVIHTHDKNCYSEGGTLICELPELEAHRHTGRCYREVRTLICTEEEDLGHAHSDACYARHRGELICTEEEDEGHTHNSSCYDVDRELTCDDDSEDHEHDDGCYTETEELTCTEEERPGHTHSDRCYEWTEELICTEEERPAGHIHTDDCYEITQVLDCGREEVIPHVHDESCYDDGGALTCGLEEVLEHRHTAECIVPPEGDPWEVQVLVCGLEEHTHTEDCYPRGEEDPLPGGEGTSGEKTEVPEEEVPAEGVPEEELPEEPEYLCGLEEHTHTEECYDPAGDLTCGLEEHTHTEDCYANEAAISELTTDIAANVSAIWYDASGAEAESGLIDGEEFGCVLNFTIPASAFDEVNPSCQYQLTLDAALQTAAVTGENCSPVLSEDAQVITLQVDGATDDTGAYSDITCALTLSGAVQAAEDQTEITVLGQSVPIVQVPVGAVFLDDSGAFTYTDTSIGLTVTLALNSSSYTTENYYLVVDRKDAANYTNALNSFTSHGQTIEEAAIYKIYLVSKSNAQEWTNLNCAYTLEMRWSNGLFTQVNSPDFLNFTYCKNPGSEPTELSSCQVTYSADGNVTALTATDSYYPNSAEFIFVRSSAPNGLIAGQYKLTFNEVKDAFLKDPAYSLYYNSNSPIGTAGSFHIVAFDSAYLKAHTNGNVLAKNLYAGANFGTSNFANELSYIQNYKQVNGSSASSTNHVLVIGSENTVEFVDNGNAFSINGTKIDKPNNLIQDMDTETSPFIDLKRVRAEISQISGNLNGYPDTNLTYTSATILNADHSKLELTNPSGVGVVNYTAAALNEKLGSYVQIDGFKTGSNGTVVINVDCTGATTINMPQARIVIDGQLQNTSEVTEFSAGKVIWNFVNADGVTINTHLMTGIILAPGATVNINQNLNGTVVADIINVNAESHRTDFTGKVTEPEETPEENEYYVTVQKIETGYAGTALPGAQFDLYKWEDNDWVKVNTDALTTGDSGTVMLHHLVASVAYKLVETKSPAGYVLKDGAFYFWVRTDKNQTQPNQRPGDFSGSIVEVGGTLLAANDKAEVTEEATSLTIRKIWKASDGAELTDITVERITVNVYQIANGDTENKTLYSTLTLSSDTNWTATLTDLPLTGTASDGSTIQYTYTVEEVAVEGFQTAYETQNGVVTVTNTQDAGSGEEYVLPETGGIGTTLYTMGGLCLMAGALLLYSLQIRRKGGRDGPC